ncbi:MAG: class I SAM-dependent methyltransferase [Chloroflexia bacterium]
MDEQAYYAAQECKSEAKVSWEYGRLLRLAGLHPPRNWRVLDAGCGAGPGLRFFSSWGNRILGLDRSFYALQRARQRVPEAGLVQGDLSVGLPFAGESFDLVLLGDVLEHLAQGERLLGECRRVLRPGGVLLVRTVNRWDIRRFFQGRRWSGVADPGHIRLYSPPELRRALREAGFEKVRVRAGVKPLLWLPLRWRIGLPGPPLLGNGLVGMGRRF